MLSFRSEPGWSDETRHKKPESRNCGYKVKARRNYRGQNNPHGRAAHARLGDDYLGILQIENGNGNINPLVYGGC